MLFLFYIPIKDYKTAKLIRREKLFLRNEKLDFQYF